MKEGMKERKNERRKIRKKAELKRKHRVGGAADLANLKITKSRGNEGLVNRIKAQTIK